MKTPKIQIKTTYWQETKPQTWRNRYINLGILHTLFHGGIITYAYFVENTTILIIYTLPILLTIIQNHSKNKYEQKKLADGEKCKKQYKTKKEQKQKK